MKFIIISLSVLSLMQAAPIFSQDASDVSFFKDLDNSSVNLEIRDLEELNEVSLEERGLFGNDWPDSDGPFRSNYQLLPGELSGDR
jgi:hypothetical protein